MLTGDRAIYPSSVYLKYQESSIFYPVVSPSLQILKTRASRLGAALKEKQTG
jgi:hypothetical protein